MARKYAVRTTRFASGERFPILVERSTGIPLFEPTLYALTEVRASNLAALTISQVARAIMVFQEFIDAYGIDLKSRALSGKILDLHEVDALVRYCRLPLDILTDDAFQASLTLVRNDTPKVISLEKARLSRRASLPEIEPNSARIRIRYIKAYLDWLIKARLATMNRLDPSYRDLSENLKTVLEAITARMPDSYGRNNEGRRQGLAPAALNRLIEIVDPNSPENPWKSRHTKVRNHLIIHWLVELGVRRGETLGVRTRLINFQKNEVFIERRADDPDDPRDDQPNAKTRDRLLAMSTNLSKCTHNYILHYRRAMPGAASHNFLFVANGTGLPLSLAMFNKIFVPIRKKIPELAEALSGHVLRHTWNDKLSEMIDEMKTRGEDFPEAREEKLRSYLAGWSEKSDTAATYTRRYVRQKAREVSLGLQNKLLKASSNE